MNFAESGEIIFVASYLSVLILTLLEFDTFTALQVLPLARYHPASVSAFVCAAALDAASASATATIVCVLMRCSSKRRGSPRRSNVCAPNEPEGRISRGLIVQPVIPSEEGLRSSSLGMTEGCYARATRR